MFKELDLVLLKKMTLPRSPTIHFEFSSKYHYSEKHSNSEGIHDVVA
jgi:hypothetical protein